MRNLSVDPEQFAAQIDYPLPEAPGWGMELRGPVEVLKTNASLGRDWLVDCTMEDRNTYVAFPKSLSEDDFKALAELQKRNNYGRFPRTGNLHFAGLPNDGSWVSIQPHEDRLKVTVRFIPLYKKEI